MLRLLRTPRWAGFTALVIAAIVGFGLLSRWQWHRAEEKRAERSALDAAAAQAPRAIATGAQPASWSPVTASGVYLPESQVVVRKRPLDAVNGFWVLTALRLDDGSTLWVNRGWMAADGPATQTPDSPAPPPGEVTVTGWWRDLQAGDPDASTLPAGMVANVAASELEPDGDYPGFLQRASSEPDDPDLVPVPRETVDEGRNISYATQWAMFAAVAVFGWFFFLRREAREDEQGQEATHD